MNLEDFELKPIEVERFQVKEVLRCLLHTILFNRALGTAVTPKEVDSEVFELSYVRVDDTAIIKHVETSVEKFVQMLEKSNETKASMTLAFYERTLKKTWFSSKEEKVFWERWIIPIAITKGKTKSQSERDRKQSSRQQIVQERVLYILQMVNEKKDHIPPVIKNVPVFPFEISFGNGEKSASTWGIDTFTRMLQQGPPMLMKAS